MNRLHSSWILTRALIAGLALAAAMPLAAQERCTDCEQARQEAKKESERQDIERLRRELQAITLQLAAAEDTIDARRMRSLRQRLSVVLRDLERAEVRVRTEERAVEREERRRRVEASAEARGEGRGEGRGVSRRPPEPATGAVPPGEAGVGGGGPLQPGRGYIGVSITMVAQTVKGPNGETLWVFHEYPRIESVDPGSPAQRAGLTAGDVIQAIEGRDVKRGVTPFPQLLRPGNELPLTIRRGGRTQSVSLQVAPRPGVTFYGPYVDTMMVRVTPEVRVNVSPRPAPPAPRVQGVPPVPPVTEVEPPRPPRAPTWQSDPSGLAGARLEPIRGELREYFDVSRGLLVIGVGAGTPASRAGLRGGDVIVASGAREIQSLRDLRDAMVAATDDNNSLPLTVVRKGEKLKLVLSWR